VDLIEGTGQIGYDGKHTYNGLFVHGDAEAWAVYRVILQQPITNDQAALLRQTLAAFVRPAAIWRAWSISLSPFATTTPSTMTAAITTGAVNYGKPIETPQWEEGIYQIEVLTLFWAGLTDF
jgi:hypothetical protein